VPTEQQRAFKLVWNLYVVAQQYNGRRSSVDNVGNIQDRVGHALDSVLHAFHVHPFAVSPEGDSRVNLPTFAILNHNHETATRHEKLARRIGRAWVDDRVRRYNAQVRDLGALQTSLFELLWSGTVEQLKRHSAYSADDPERPEFEKAVEELEKDTTRGNSSFKEATLRDCVLRDGQGRQVAVLERAHGTGDSPIRW
jgi:hypothetical protein